MVNTKTKERSKQQLIAEMNYRFNNRLLSGIGDYNDYLHFKEVLGLDVKECNYSPFVFSIDELKEIMSSFNKQVNKRLKDIDINDALNVKLFINSFIDIGIAVGAQCQFIKDNNEFYGNMRKQYLELKNNK